MDDIKSNTLDRTSNFLSFLSLTVFFISDTIAINIKNVQEI